MNVNLGWSEYVKLKKAADKKKKAKAKKSAAPKSGDPLINFRASITERRLMMKAARESTEGNLSQWLRRTALKAARGVSK